MADVLEEDRPIAAPVQPETSEASASRPQPRRSALPRPAPAKKEGLPPITWALAAIAVAMLLWGAWVTKHIAAPPAQVPMASVRLEALVTEYVQAQSHANGTPDAVTQQTARFMGAIEDELKRIGANGTTVLVGEAVLSKNVPDITDQVRRAVYAKVPLPPAAPAAAPQVGAAAAAPSAALGAPGAAAGVAPSPFAAALTGPALPGAAPSLAGGGNGVAN
jgi:hypothetical protein